MLSTTRLVRRGEVYYFRMAVPCHLASRAERSEVKVSLRTSDPLAAKVRVRLLSNALDVLFKGLEVMPQVSKATIDERIKDYFQSCLNRSLEHSHDLRRDRVVVLAKEVAYLRDCVEVMRKELTAHAFSQSVVADATLLLTQITSDTGKPDPEALQYACDAVLRAKIENARILAALLSGQYEETPPRDPLFVGMQANVLPVAPGEQAPVNPKAITLRTVGERYLAFKAKTKWAKKTDADARRALKLGYEVIGEDRPVRLITPADVAAVRDLIGALPPNYMKGVGNQKLTAKQAAEKNKAGTALALQTQEKMLRFFMMPLIWAADEGYLDKPPGLKVKVAGVNKLKKIDGRHPYSSDQLKAIFSSPVYA